MESDLHRDGLLLQVLMRLEGKIDAQEALIYRLFRDQEARLMAAAMETSAALVRVDNRAVLLAADSGWHTKWLGGCVAMIGTVAMWLWYHVARIN
jgi:hypothetical protein